MPATVVEGSVINGRYRLDTVIGHGGMADVYAGRDEFLDRPVAVKVPHPPYRGDDRFVRRFAKEARAAAALNHPNVVAVFDRGDVDRCPYLVMELVEGTTLRRLMDQERFSEPAALRIARDVCRALEYAHSRGFVHRDLKPDNVLITTDGVTKVTDFGIVRAIGDRTITSTRPLGSVAYVSPEQASGGEVDARSDLYSLGIVLHELLTGTRPFDAESPIAVALAHIETTPPAVRDVAPGVSTAAARVVARALAKDPRDRFSSAAEMREAIERALHVQEPTLLLTDDLADDPAFTGPHGSGPVEAPATTVAVDPDAPTVPPPAPAPATPPTVDPVWNWNRQRVSLLLVATAAAAVLAALFPSPWTVRVPTVVGLEAVPAERLLGEHHLGMLVVSPDGNGGVPAGRVVRQEPAAGTEVRRGGVVSVELARPGGD